MGRIKNLENFGRRNYSSETKTPEKFYILSVEGNNTEFDYFTLLNDYREDLGINAKIKIELLDRGDDTKSSPKWVKDLLDEYVNEFIVDSNDSLWMIIDRDEQSNSPESLIDLFQECKNSNFNVAFTNPCFELWLLMHCISNFDDYDKDVLLDNPKRRAKSRKRYIENILTDLNGSYNKKNINKEHFIDISKIKNAIRLERELENDIGEMINKLGSNVGTLVNELLD